MSQVTNQLPYEELKPLPQAKEFYPRLVKLMKSVALVATVVIFSVGAGVAIGLSNWNISVFAGAIGGGLIGLIAGIAMAMLSKLPTKVEQYRLETLKNIKSVIGNARALKTMKNLEDFFYYPFTQFIQPFHHHMMHCELAIIGDAIPQDRPDARKVWTEFLDHLDSTPLLAPDREKIVLNTAFQLSRFSGKTIKIQKEWWDPKQSLDWEIIEKIGREAFGNDYAFSAEKIKTTMEENLPSGLCFARNEETKEILGYGWYYTEDGTVHIPEIARLPEACSLNIGKDLLYEILTNLRSEPMVQISIRKSNPFIERLKGWKFEVEKELPKHFPAAPPEDGVLMKLDWKKVNQQ